MRMLTHEPRLPPALVAAGTAYADGRLSVDEVAILLGITVPDAIAQLEEQGFRREVDDLRLNEAARRERLLAIRSERIARQGNHPEAKPDLVNRDVIASQRIEDIDARPWLRA